MYGNTTASSQIGASAKPETLGDHLVQIRNAIGEENMRLSAIADRVVGSVPNAVGNDKPGSPTHMSVLSDIRAMLSQLRDQVNRLDNVL